MDWTLDGFYANGGATEFTNRLSATLGIPAYRIRVVAAYTGSVVVDFFIDTITQAAEGGEGDEILAEIIELTEKIE